MAVPNPKIQTKMPLFLLATTTVIIIIPVLATPTTALIPYTPPLWDMMMNHLPYPNTMDQFQDPFRVLEQIPIPFPKETLALARADWKETPTSHLITLDIPGLKKDDIKIEVEENRVLRVSGERKVNKRVSGERKVNKNSSEEEKETEREKWHRAERVNGKFLRQFRLPMNADLEKVKAHLEDRVLSIVVPKFAEERRRQPKVINIASQPSAEDIKATKAEI